MPLPDIAFLAMVVCALSLFAGVLGWASWRESRATHRKTRS